MVRCLKYLAIIAVMMVLVETSVHAAEPFVYHMTCYQGADCRTTFRLKAAGKPVDLTGAVFGATVRSTYTAPTPLAEFNIDTSSLKQGEVTVTLPASVLATLAGKTGYWDLRQTEPGGTVWYRVRGQWKCVYSATR